MEKSSRLRAFGFFICIALASFAAQTARAADCTGSVTVATTVSGSQVSATINNDTNEGVYACFYYGQRANGESNMAMQRSANPVGQGQTNVSVTLNPSEYTSTSNLHVVLVTSATACNSSYDTVAGSAFCDHPVPEVVGTGTGKAGPRDDDGDDEDKDTDTTQPAYTQGSMTSVTFNNFIGAKDFTTLVQNVLKWVLGMAGSVALLLLIYGGIIYMTATGDPTKAQQGKKIVTWTIAGLVVILMSYSFMMVLDKIFAQTTH